MITLQCRCQSSHNRKWPRLLWQKKIALSWYCKWNYLHITGSFMANWFFLIYPLKTKKTKTKCRVFTNNSLILVKLFKKKPKYFLWKNPKITILFWVLVFSFTYLVLVYPMDSTLNNIENCCSKLISSICWQRLFQPW